MNVVLHVERLVLDAGLVGSARAAAIADAVRAHLATLLVEGGCPTALLAGGTVDRLRTAPLRFDGVGGAAALGRAIAGSVVDGMSARPPGGTPVRR